MNTNLTKITSSQIAAVGHEGTTLTVQFNNGSTYEYANVPVGKHTEMMEAPSVGSYFSANIKKFPSTYPFTQVK